MLKYILVSCLAAISPMIPVMTSVFVLIIFDLITGIWASIKSGESFRSSALRRTVSKFFVYEIVLLSSFLAQTYLIGDSLPIVKIAGGIVALTEITSVAENCNIIYGSNLFKRLLLILGSKNDLPKKE